jgi:hypothetical protein
VITNGVETGRVEDVVRHSDPLIVVSGAGVPEDDAELATPRTGHISRT